MHAYIHTYMTACMYTYIHAHIHTYMIACMHTYIHVCIHTYIHDCMYAYVHTYMCAYIHTYIHVCIHQYIHTWLHVWKHTYIHTYIHTCVHTYIHTYKDVSVAEWLAWLTSSCGRIGAIGSSPSNGLKPNMWGQKGFNPLCQCVYIYVCIVNPDIQTIHRCSHTSIHTSQSQVCPQGQAR